MTRPTFEESHFMSVDWSQSHSQPWYQAQVGVLVTVHGTASFFAVGTPCPVSAVNRHVFMQKK